MAKHYSQFARYCLRFYSRHSEEDCGTLSEWENWKAANKAVQDISESDWKTLDDIYSGGVAINEKVVRVARTNHMSQQTLWKKMNDLEREVARNRGLIE